MEELKVFERTGNASKLRAEGFLPAVVYDKHSNRSIYVELKAFDRVFRKVATHAVISLKFEGGETVDTLVKAVGLDKRKRIPNHADFYIVSDEPVELQVPLHAHGEARGVREDSGVLDVVMHTLTIRVSPKKIPNELIFEVSDLGVNGQIHVRDLPLPEGVEVMADLDALVATVLPPRVDENVTQEVAVEPEVIAKGKSDDEE